MTSPTPLSAARGGLAGAGDGENAYFGGGGVMVFAPTAIVDIYKNGELVNA